MTHQDNFPARRLARVLVLVSILSGGTGARLYARLQVQAVSSVASPQPLGTTITFTASASDSNAGNPVTYRFETSPDGVNFSVAQDYSLTNAWLWTPNTQEGSYVIRVTARDYLAGLTSPTLIPFTVNSRVAGANPVVVSTANPLVALFSAPSCPAGSSMRVSFRLNSSGAPTAYTPLRPCHPPTSMNFYIAGMMASSTYVMHYEISTGGVTSPNPVALLFTTGPIPASLALPASKVLVAPGSQSDTALGIVISSFARTDSTLLAAYPDATDLNGNIIWYYPVEILLTRVITGDPLLGTTFTSIVTAQGTGTGTLGTFTGYQGLAEFDLAGNVIRQTNCDRVSEQLLGLGTDAVAGFSHDAIRLPNGDTIVIGMDQRIFPAGTQGSTGPVDILGNILIELDSNFQVLWYWNAFDHDGGGTQLDINRPAILAEKCTEVYWGCPGVLLSIPANDWLHGNSVQYEAADGSLVFSMRNQDWVIKIDFGNGNGTQNVLWRLGEGGDFTMLSAAPIPWFSGQHDPEFQGTQVAGGPMPQLMTMLDNGDTRVAQDPGTGSRGSAYAVDQTAMTVEFYFKTSLNVYSYGLGSAQILPNKNYWFDAGWLSTGPNEFFEQSTEYTPAGEIVYQVQAPTTAYRSWRMPSMYTISGTYEP